MSKALSSSLLRARGIWGIIPEMGLARDIVS